MEIPYGEATYNKEDLKPFWAKAFELAGFTRDQAEESVLNSKEVTYTLDNKVVRFVKFEPLSEFVRFYFQYQVMILTEEDKKAPKKILSYQNSTRKEESDDQSHTKKTKIAEKPRLENDVQKIQGNPKEENTSAKQDQLQTHLGDEESKELTGDELKEHLEANGQQTLF